MDEIIFIIFTFFYGLWLVRQGRLMYKYGVPILLPNEKIGLWFLELIAGEERALIRKSELMRAERIQRMGKYAYSAGMIFVSLGILSILWIIVLVFLGKIG